jgi:hypothetical protein
MASSSDIIAQQDLEYEKALMDDIRREQEEQRREEQQREEQRREEQRREEGGRVIHQCDDDVSPVDDREISDDVAALSPKSLRNLRVAYFEKLEKKKIPASKRGRGRVRRHVDASSILGSRTRSGLTMSPR